MPPIRQNSNESQRRPLTGGSQSTTRLEGMRAGLQQLFTGRSSVGPSRERESDMEELRSPKTPVLSFRENELPSTHIRIPGLVRTGTWTSIRTSSRRSSRNSERSDVPDTPRSTRPITPESLQRTITNRPAPAYTPHVRSNSGSRFVGVDPAEAELAQLADTGRRRRRRRARPMAGRGCAPKIKNKKIRSKILSTIVSAIFLTLMLTIYLALALSNREESQEFHVLLILIILVTTIFFCHALIRLCMMLINPPPDEDEHPRAFPGMLGPGGFADPAVPIRVALARDEEAAGIESEATKVPPPAYGLWRESVRVDPNRIFWQRNNAQQQTIREENERPQTANRPPSYISENGIDYVVEAAPRHITPTTDVPLPPHPSERGRWNMPSPHS